MDAAIHLLLACHRLEAVQDMETPPDRPNAERCEDCQIEPVVASRSITLGRFADSPEPRYPCANELGHSKHDQDCDDDGGYQEGEELGKGGHGSEGDESSTAAVSAGAWLDVIRAAVLRVAVV